MNLSLILCVLLLIFSVLGEDVESEKEQNEDLYELLGVSRDSDTREIRKAFKKLAVKLHPDKNKDDKEAAAKFVKLARAYEILKDTDTRKEYDLYGDTGDSKAKPQPYHSYTYYRDQFGIYDDDPLIITLSKADYEVNIMDDTQTWFVNFYSTQCHHCHELAPTWRKLAAELEGIVRIAAVNCEEDWVLCHQLKISSYPTLLYYSKEARINDGIPYTDDRTLKAFEKYIISQISAEIKEITVESWENDGLKKQRWLLLLCANNNIQCPEEHTRTKLAATLEGLIPVGIITDPHLCDSIHKDHKTNSVIFWKVDEQTSLKDSPNTEAEVHAITGSDTKKMVDTILEMLPSPQLLLDDSFGDVRFKLREGADVPWLICFYIGAATELNLQLKRLPALLPNMNIGWIHCGRSSSLCSSLHVSHYPAWGVLKSGGAFELHHGRDVLHEIVTFAKDSSKSTNLHALSPADFYNLLKGGGAWFIDWYAPWCPPCKRLMPEIRKASQHFTPKNIQFGTIDCTLHVNLCSNEGVRAYPTTMLYNGSQIHYFHGVPNEEGIVEFVQDMLHPNVINLDSSSFVQLMRKPERELWIVDFYAPWCGPCQKLSLHWRALAKQVSNLDFVRVAQVDCVANADLCTAQNIRGYPTIRLYPLKSKGLNTVALYNGQRDTLSIKSWLVGFLPSPVEQLNAKDFKWEVLTDQYYLPWLIDFYAPWCGHCTHFEPDFIQVAQKLGNRIRSGKVDCEAERALCRELRVGSYPTVMLYFSPTERYEIETHVPLDIVLRVKALIAERKSHIRDEL